MIKPNKRNVKTAEQVLTLTGDRHNATIVAIRAIAKLTKDANVMLWEIINGVVGNRAIPTKSGDHLLLIYSPSVSGTINNELIALKAAKSIEEKIKESNRKFREKIMVGIGVHAGDIIDKIEGEVLKFTGVGKTINNAKKVADMSEGEAIFSKEVRDKIYSEIKAEKIMGGGELEIYAVTRIIDKEQNEKFLQDFLRRS